jgi:hypothetical protein
MSPPSQGYLSTRMDSRVSLDFPSSQLSRSHRPFNTHNNPKYTNSLLPSLHNPREWTPFSATQSLRLSISSRAPVLLVKNLHAGTLRTHNCDLTKTRAKASKTCRNQLLVGIHQQYIQPTNMYFLSNLVSFPEKLSNQMGQVGEGMSGEQKRNERCDHQEIE